MTAAQAFFLLEDETQQQTEPAVLDIEAELAAFLVQMSREAASGAAV